ncbi:MAG TPA: hypothetical protein VJP80_01825 [Candidatus Saccharimonadales bacterium]|nr:hypothetical protein [Candidatus Saccharimonadales bacterium]
MAKGRSHINYENLRRAIEARTYFCKNYGLQPPAYPPEPTTHPLEIEDPLDADWVVSQLRIAEPPEIFALLSEQAVFDPRLVLPET